MSEQKLEGGHQNNEVVRKGEAVHRECAENTVFVRELLEHLESEELKTFPRYLGVDEKNREIFRFLHGKALHPSSIKEDGLYQQLAMIMRELHDSTHDHPLACGQECVIHGDISPSNTVVEGSHINGIIDWDCARPGHRLEDLGWVAWKWCLLDPITYSQPPQYHKIKVLCDTYDPSLRADLFDTIPETRENQRTFIKTSIQQGKFNPEQLLFFEKEALMIEKEEIFFKSNYHLIKASLGL
jgi:hypothetical protein